MKTTLLALATMSATMISLAADKETPAKNGAATLKTQKEQISYIMGRNIGSTWKRQDIDVDVDLVARGIKEAFQGDPALFTDPEMREIMTAFQKDVRSKQEEKRKQLGVKNKKEGETFLAENKSKPGVIALPSGLQYQVLTQGKGPKPKSNDVVTVNYRGTFVDGAEFDSSEKQGKPATFAVNGVVKGWTEALQLMPVGSKWKLFVPSSLAYGEYGNGRTVAGNATLIFDVELVSIQPPSALPGTAAAPTGQPITSDIIKVPSAEEMKKGAKIEVIKPDQIDKEKQAVKTNRPAQK